MSDNKKLPTNVGCPVIDNQKDHPLQQPTSGIA